MKAFLAAVLFAVVAAVGTAFLLDNYQRNSHAAFPTDSIRLGNPGDNLVGKS